MATRKNQSPKLKDIISSNTDSKQEKNSLSDQQKFILMALLKEEPLNLEEIENKAFLFVSQLGIQKKEPSTPHPPSFKRAENRKMIIPLPPFGGLAKKYQKDKFNVNDECNDLVKQNFIVLNDEKKYELTKDGKILAKKSTETIENLSYWVGKRFLQPEGAAKNTVIVDLFLAIIKLLAGFLSGSIALLADGADATVDTVSATVVWYGIKRKKELLGTIFIIIMMFITAISIGYESITTLYEAIVSTIPTIEMPYLVITVEFISLIFAFLLSIYQHYVGKRYGSLALISQSIDSKNHIYVSTAVIIGAIFSLYGVHFLYTIIGSFIAVRILFDGLGLSKEAISSMKGEETDFSKYKSRMEKYWQHNKLESFNNWILFSIKNKGQTTKDDLVFSLVATFQPEYIPIFSEFEFSLGKGIDFEKEFDTIVKPLLNKKFLIQKDEKFVLTKDGRKYISHLCKNIKYHG
jgi:cation diffusion facilitator family transporter